VTGSAGKVTTRLFVPADASGPIKYNAYIAPQGELWPNMIAQTSFEAPLGEKVMDPCAPLRNSARTPKQVRYGCPLFLALFFLVDETPLPCLCWIDSHIHI
jgi:hypothetical protein